MYKKDEKNTLDGQAFGHKSGHLELLSSFTTMDTHQINRIASLSYKQF